jgi:hypothetical protein
VMATTYELISSVTLGTASADVEFTSIPGSFAILLAVYSARSTDTSNPGGHIEMSLTLNSSTSNFSVRQLYGDGSSAASNTPTNRNAGLITNANATANTFSSTELLIPNYAGSTNKSYSFSTATEANATLAYIAAGAGLWADTSAITALKLAPTLGNFAAESSFQLFGITKA